tara:strand:- start:750 stop:1478 length:729 start_codon:yes stop_codon:yes gene_type:complete
MASKSENIYISKETIKRLAKDVKDIYKNPLEEHGIYYIHDEDDILKGQALIIGPKNTPYSYGNYLFTFKYPSNYPFSPPIVTYYTNDGLTRFNPNLYKNGKVCISILNTWKGPQWTSCQTISSILLCICASVMNDTPLLNEPGITNNHEDYNNYNKIINYKNYEIAIAEVISNNKYKLNFPKLHSIICENFLKNYENIIINLNSNLIFDNEEIEINIYRMKVKTTFKNIKNKIENIYKLLKN